VLLRRRLTGNVVGGVPGRGAGWQQVTARDVADQGTTVWDDVVLRTGGDAAYGAAGARRRLPDVVHLGGRYDLRLLQRLRRERGRDPLGPVDGDPLGVLLRAGRRRRGSRRDRPALHLGLPWVFDITDSPTPLADPGPDKGRQHVELASSQDLLTWSRPSLGDLITPGAAGSWDWGWDMTGTTLRTVGDQVRLYYAAFQGQHNCSSGDVSADLCTTPFGNSRVGLVTWPKDRFESFHAGTGGGGVTTRTLSPSGSTLSVNVAPGSGSPRVEVLDAAGDPVPGYAAADATPITADTLGAAVRWGTRTALPAGPLRLRFELTAGDLYSYTIG